MLKFLKSINSRYLFHSILLLVEMLLLFFATERGVSSSGIGLFIRKSIVCAISIYITQVVTKTPFFHVRWAAQLFLMVWWHLFLLWKFYIFNFRIGGDCIYENEIIIGVYSSASFIMIQYFCEKYVENTAIPFLAELVKSVFLFVPVVTIVHYKIYGQPIIYEEMLAVYHTTFREAVEWVSTYVGIANSILLLFCMIIVLMGSYALRSRLVRCHEDDQPPRNKYFVVLAVVALLYYPCFTLAGTDWVKDYVLAVRYSRSIRHYENYVSEAKNTIEMISGTQVSDRPHTVVMVIGESAGRDYMKSYTRDFPYDNTPWLDACKNNPDFIVFTNAYGCHSLTQQVLENALTEKSQYNKKTFLESMNLIDIAKKKGYKTYWITNMTGGNSASTFSLVASRADQIYQEESAYDDNMLKFLSKIDPTENNFIIFHGNGSHAAYRARYPKERTVFHDNNVEAQYSNAIRFVDDFLKYIHEYGVQHLNLQVMIYYSDHGENLLTGHGPSDHSFDKVRIPMFVYLGSEYQTNNLEKYNRLTANKEAFFTNDMIYNTFSGLIDAESNFYDSAEDLSAADYAHSLKDLYTFGGVVKVAEDPFLR